MKLSGITSWTSIAMAIVFVALSYDMCMQEPRLGGSLVRRCALTCVDIMEMISLGLVNLQKRLSTTWIRAPVLFEVYQVKRAFQTIRYSFYKIPDNIKVEVTRIAVNGRPALHHCPEGDFSKHLLPGIIYFHGGSWISGSAEEWRPLTAYLSNTSKAIVISVDYRLAPQHIFPAAFEDALKATLGILEAAEQYGVDPNSIAIAGDDVGGNLALAVALNISKDRDKYPEMPELKLVGMFYPSLQAFDFTLPSYVRYSDGPSFHNRRDVIMGTLSYLVGDADDWVIRVLSTSSHVTKELQESALYKAIFDIDLLPFSFRQWREEPQLLYFVNQTLEREIRTLVQDTRFSAMLAPLDDLALLPHTYFICPEIDPRRDDSFFTYARLLEMDSSKTEHIYYDSEKYGFLVETASNDRARSALDKFSKHFENILTSFENSRDVERSVFITEEETDKTKSNKPNK